MVRLDERLIQRAADFASGCHYAVRQVRKYTGEPYIHHPARVALQVRNAGGTSEMIAAAWLHDTAEDTRVTFGVIESYFGPVVRSYVEALTDPPTVPGGPNRAARQAATRERLAGQPGAVHTIKLADLLDNTASILEHDREFAAVYLPEKQLLLSVLTKGDPGLYQKALDQVTAGLASLAPVEGAE